MKAILVPYAYPEECTWAEEIFPNHSIAALPVCGKPMLAYSLDALSNKGVTVAMVLDRHYDRHLAEFLGDGSKWGMKLVYTGSDDFISEENLRRRHSAFIGQNEVLFVYGNAIADFRVRSLRDYYELNMSLLEDQLGCVLPGYSVDPGVFVGSDVGIQPGADVKGPVSIGDDVRIGRSAKISKAILGNGCVIEHGVKICESIIFAETYVGKHVEFIQKIVNGSRVIDPITSAYVDLSDDGISEPVNAPKGGTIFPASSVELHARQYTAIKDPAAEASLAEILSDLARDIAALDFPKLEGIFLGGGYGRGEGGAPIYNDLDFFPLVRNLRHEEEREEIQVALNALSLSYGFKIGIHIDFCRPMTHADFQKIEHRLMIQELLRGFVPIYGNAEALSFLKKYPAAELPASEALRLLVNRGMGLYLARSSQDQDFVNRNINKAVLGSGDAILVAENRYLWTCRDRMQELGDERYTKAVEFKFHPVGTPAISWEEAKAYWQEASERVMKARGKELETWSIYHQLRYMFRRRRFGGLEKMGMDPLMRIFTALKNAMQENLTISDEIMKDWEVFN